MPHDAPGSLLQSFDWSEVSCFLRPQAILCDRASQGTGAVLLGLASLYRSTGIDGFYVERARDHFAFLQGPFERITGVRFAATYFRDGDDVLEWLASQLAQDPRAASIVPADLKWLPAASWHGQEHRQHFFLITGCDSVGGAFEAYDNAHVNPDGLSLQYETRVLPRPALQRMVESYRDRYAGLPSSTRFNTEYWTLQVGGVDRTVVRAGDEAHRPFLTECSAVLDRIEHHIGASESLDDVYQGELLRAHDCRDGDRVNRLARGYLADANHATVFVRVIAHALRKLGQAAAADAVSLALVEYKHRASAVRMQLLTRVIAGVTLPPAKWDEARSKLAAASRDLRCQLLSVIQDAG